MTETLQKPLTETLAPLIAEYAGLFTAIAAIDAQAAEVMNTICGEYSDAWSYHKSALEKTKAALDAAIPADCESMSIATLAGKLTIRRTAALEIADEAATVVKLKELTVTATTRLQHGWNQKLLSLLRVPQPVAQVEPSIFIHTEERPNREALEKLDDALLAHLGVRRVTKLSWTFAPVKMKAPKPAKAGEKSEAKNETGGSDDAK